MDKWLKIIEDNTNNVSTSKQPENSRADSSPTPSTGSLSTTLEGKHNDYLISSDKKLAKIIKTIRNTDLHLPLLMMYLALSV